MQFIRIFNKRFQFLLCVIDIFSKYEWADPWKTKKDNTITNAFQKVFDQSGCTPNKIWLDKGSDFYNRSIKSWFQDSDIEIYSRHNEGKSCWKNY